MKLKILDRDGRRSIGCGVRMEEAELEEGEALRFQSKAEDFTIDPDVALSYIEEKLQNVLGHFQKDFEGGVSAENLGAKFGGYGSFLPTYQRSPTWSHTKSSAEAHHNVDSQRSLKKLHVEKQSRNSLVASSASPSAKPHITSGKVTPISSNLKGNDSCVQSRNAEESGLRSADVKKIVNSSEQRTLKVRIKVGSKSLPTQKNAEIYSGLGLVASPSSSLDECPTTEGQFGKLYEAPEASPTFILQIMTSFPDGLLSPLSEDMMCLTEKMIPRGRDETKTVDKKGVESSGTSENVSLFSKTNKMKPKLLKKGGLFSMELTNPNIKGNNEYAQAIGVEKSRKLCSLSKVSEFKRQSLVGNNAACPPVGQCAAMISKGRCEEALNPAPAHEKSFTEGKSKKKPKVVYTKDIQCESSSKLDLRDLPKDHEKPENRYRDFFGDIEFEDNDKESISGNVKSPARLKNPQVGKRSSSDDHNMMEGKFDIRFSKNPHVQENYHGSPSQSASPNKNEPSSEAPVGSVPLVQEDWVSCDKCEKWRLLPLGTNVSSLPDKWLCRMLTWLPGMNRCSIPQEETTNALRALYHPNAPILGPTSKSRHSQLNNNSAVNSAQMASADAKYCDQENENHASESATVIGKQKHWMAKAAHSNDIDGSNSSNIHKKSLGTSAITNNSREKTLLSRQSGFAAEKHSGHKIKNFIVSNSTEKGTILNIKTRGEADTAGSRVSKRMKSDGLHVEDDYWTSVSCNDKDSLRKRKANDLSDQRKEKKIRILKSGGKEVNGSYTTVNPSVAANSSSSMVSSSHKNKIIGHDVKGVRSGENERDMVKRDAVLCVKKAVSDVPRDKDINVENSSGKCKIEEKANIVLSQKKSWKGLSSHSRDEARACGSDIDGVHNSSHNTLSCEHLYEGLKSRKGKIVEKSGTPSKVEKFTGQQDSARGTPVEGSKGQNLKKFAIDEKYIIKNQDKKHHIHQEHDNEKLPKRGNQPGADGNGKSHTVLALAKNFTESVSRTKKDNNVQSSAIKVDNDDGQKALNHKTISNGQPICHRTSYYKARDIDVPSPFQRDSSSHAANIALKEAKGLKHLADRLKNSGSTESVGLYFQAALKFLHGASLLDTGSIEATEQNELVHSMHIYSSTAKLCEFCANEYEKLKDMAAAALAYKCMEVAYLRVIYSSHNSANKDRAELQTALQIAHPGESPSSSASDVDNLNHLATTDKAALAKVVGSSQVSGSHILTAHNCSGFSRILNFTRVVTFAMEASSRSRIALSAATAKLGESSDKDYLDSLKTALDFSFQDVEGFLCLVRFAVEAISRTERVSFPRSTGRLLRS